VPANLLRRFTKLDHAFDNFSNFPEFGAASNYTSRIEYKTGVRRNIAERAHVRQLKL